MEYAELMDGAQELLETSQIDFNDMFQVDFAKRLATIIHSEIDGFMDENGDDTPKGAAIPIDMVVPPRTLETIGARMDVTLKEYAVCTAFHDLLINSGYSADGVKFSEISLLIEKHNFGILDDEFKQIANGGNPNSPLTEFSKKAIGINDVDEFTRLLESILISKGITVILDLPPVLTKFINGFRDLIGISLSDTTTSGNYNPQTTH